MNGQIELYGNSIQDQIRGSGSLPQCYLYTPPSPRLPREFELVIEKVGSEIDLDYGAKLRILIAEPIKGMHLRDAIQKLKEALIEVA